MRHFLVLLALLGGAGCDEDPGSPCDVEANARLNLNDATAELAVGKTFAFPTGIQALQLPAGTTVAFSSATTAEISGAGTATLSYSPCSFALPSGTRMVAPCTLWLVGSCLPIEEPGPGFLTLGLGPDTSSQVAVSIHVRRDGTVEVDGRPFVSPPRPGAAGPADAAPAD